MMKLYQDILSYFHVYQLYDGLFDSNGLVKPDDIHDAIITVGVSMNEPFEYYIQKAFQKALNRVNVEKRRGQIIHDNVVYLLGENIEIETLAEYNFEGDEITLVLELVSGIKAYKSKIPRRKYNRVLANVKLKINKGQ